MGPRPFGRGDGHDDALSLLTRAELQWGHAHSGVETARCHPGPRDLIRASMGPRPFGRGDALVTGTSVDLDRLQWGHAHSGVETGGVGVADDVALLASMGPRPFGRGDLTVPRATRSPTTGFNGATPIRAWRRPVCDELLGAHDWLQWGRAHSGVETRVAGTAGERRRPASMGPRPFGRGDVPVVAENLSSALLQWGHAHSGVETEPRLRCCCTHERASMGPRPFGRGDDPPRLAEGRGHHASMGPRPFGRGDVDAGRGTAARARGFNGATPIRAWRPRQRGAGTARLRRFNGATPIRAWRRTAP